MNRPCLTCGALTPGTRCKGCTLAHNRATSKPKPPRAHYSGDYRKRAAAVRAGAVICWLCGQGARPDDPWQADHVVAGDPFSLLAPAHRSCNASRKDQAPTAEQWSRLGAGRGYNGM